MKERRRYVDRREYLIKAVTKRRKKMRQMAIDYKGGVCSRCNYSKCPEALEFHHISDKAFGVSANGITRSWTKTQIELDKCILLCANCHRELHASQKLQPQGETLE
jgi:5-methylcytosine-specific restriction endonuclease McrA